MAAPIVADLLSAATGDDANLLYFSFLYERGHGDS
jgi:hypothetical protein